MFSTESKNIILFKITRTFLNQKVKEFYHNLQGDAVHGLQEQQLLIPLICTYGFSEIKDIINIHFFSLNKTNNKVK